MLMLVSAVSMCDCRAVGDGIYSLLSFQR